MARLGKGSVESINSMPSFHSSVSLDNGFYYDMAEIESLDFKVCIDEVRANAMISMNRLRNDSCIKGKNKIYENTNLLNNPRFFCNIRLCEGFLDLGLQLSISFFVVMILNHFQ